VILSVRTAFCVTLLLAAAGGTRKATFVDLVSLAMRLDLCRSKAELVTERGCGFGLVHVSRPVAACHLTPLLDRGLGRARKTLLHAVDPSDAEWRVDFGSCDWMRSNYWHAVVGGDYIGVTQAGPDMALESRLRSLAADWSVRIEPPTPDFVSFMSGPGTPAAS